MAQYGNPNYHQYDARVIEKLHMMGRVCYNMFRILRLQSYDISSDPFFIYLQAHRDLTGRNLDSYQILEQATPEMFIDYWIGRIGHQSIEDGMSLQYARIQYSGEQEQYLEYCWVYYISPNETGSGNITSESLKPFLSELSNKKNMNYQKIFLISPKKLQPQALSSIIDNPLIQLRYMDNMLYDVASHSLQPHVHILSEPEVVSLAASSGLTFSVLPRIPESDPLMRDYGAKSGDVIQVLSFSGIQEELSDLHISYLAVINSWAKK